MSDYPHDHHFVAGLCTVPGCHRPASPAAGRKKEMTTFKLEQTEAQFQETVQELATSLGWKWMHVEKVANNRGYWRTPVRGMLGRGFPDLLMVRDTRMIAAELKGHRGRYSEAQEQVLGWLSEVGFIEVYRWKPDDWDTLLKVLK